MRDALDQNPYVRPDLPATRSGVCDPACEIESRLGNLADLLAGWSPQGPAVWNYDLLATLTWMKRIRPEFLTRLDCEDLVGQGRRLVESQGAAAAQEAIWVPNPEGWLEEAEALQATYEDAGDPTERATRAYRLFNDLDDAELLQLAAAQVGIDDGELDRGLDRCRAWFVAHADLFLGAGVYVQALGQALRPELARTDPKLARTADKLIWMLDALEELEADLEFRGIDPIPADVTWLLLERQTAGQPPFGPEEAEGGMTFGGSPAGFIQPTILEYPYLAKDIVPEAVARWAAQGVVGEFTPRLCEWIAPDGRHWALLAIFSAPAPSDPEPATITFHDADGGPAPELVGQSAQVGAASGWIEDVGENTILRVSWDQLHQSGELRLRVGPDRIEWPPRPAMS
jgi:hypothetical protein